MSKRNGRGLYPIEELTTQYPSVTTICDVLEKYGIHPWIADTDVRYYHEQTIGPFMRGEISLDQLKEINFEAAIKDACHRHDEESREAKDFGSRVHAALDLYHKTGAHPIEKDLLVPFMLNLEWEKSVELEVIESERMVYSETHRYAGTLDLWCRIRMAGMDRMMVGVLDYKTFNGKDGKKFRPYLSHEYQIAAYVAALEEQEDLYDDRLDFGLIMGLNKETGEPFPKLYLRNELLKPFEDFSYLAAYFNIVNGGKR